MDSTWDNVDLLNQAEERERQVIDRLKNCETTKKYNILNMRLIGSIGRDCALQNKKSETITLLVEDLSIISHTPEVDVLTFWKYAQSLKKFRSVVEIMSVTPLDTFAAFFSNNQSFRIGEKEPDSIALEPGFSRDMRVKSKVNTDRHVVLRDNPSGLIPVELHYRYENTKIFATERKINNRPGFVIEDYKQPIWVSPLEEKCQSESAIGFCIHYLEYLMSWLIMVKPELSKHLDVLDDSPIEVFISPNSFCEGGLGKNEASNHGGGSHSLPIVINHHGQRIEFSVCINEGQKDNKNDKNLMVCLLQNFGKLIEQLGHKNGLTPDESKRIVDAYIPAGRTQAFTSVPLIGNAALNRQGLVELRMVQLYDLSEANAELVHEWKNQVAFASAYEGTNTTHDICNKAVDYYYKGILSLMAQYSDSSLLRVLIDNNEAICNHRAERALLIQRSIEQSEDINYIFEKQIEELPQLDHVALANRALIEMLAAEPGSGTREATMEDLDRLLALADRLIMWGNLSDQIYLKISKPSITLYENGRVEIRNDATSEVWDTFHKAKELENLEQANYIEDQKFRKFTGDYITEGERDEAYLDEFGSSFSQIINFFAFLISLGFDESTVMPIRLDLLKQKLKADLNYSDKDVENLLENFALFPREKWEKYPAGFSKFDIYPWRYNRRLSHFRRPLIVSKTDGQNELFWGPRHVEESMKQLVYQVETGRFVSKMKQSKMSSLIGKIIKELGDTFTSQVKKEIDGFHLFLTVKNVDIGPHGPLYDKSDLGDVDVFVIDQKMKRIFLLECKNVHLSRNPHEITQEMERFYKTVDGKESWIDKHIKRAKWVQSNIAEVKKMFKIADVEYSIHPMFVTSIEIPSAYFRNAPLPFISYSQLIKNEAGALHTSYKP